MQADLYYIGAYANDLKNKVKLGTLTKEDTAFAKRLSELADKVLRQINLHAMPQDKMKTFKEYIEENNLQCLENVSYDYDQKKHKRLKNLLAQYGVQRIHDLNRTQFWKEMPELIQIYGTWQAVFNGISHLLGADMDLGHFGGGPPSVRGQFIRKEIPPQ